MASAFEGVVRSVVRELDRSKELTPVDSLRTSASYQPYCLVGRKRSISWFWRPRYTCVNLSIKDILEPDAPEPAVERVGPFHFHDTVDGQLQGSVELAAPGQGTLAGGAMVSGSSSASMNVCTLRVAPNTWEALHQERRLRQPEHKVLQQLRRRGDDVFVVTEVLQTQAEMEVTRTHKQEGSGQFALPGPICLQGKGQGHLSRKKTVTIPSGSTLAFRAAQLVIGPDWDILFFPNKKQRTFAQPQAGEQMHSQGPAQPGKKTLRDGIFSSAQYNSGRPGPALLPVPAGHTQESSSFSVRKDLFDRLKFQSDGPAEGWLVPTEDFQGLQMEVRDWARALEDVSATLCGQLLGGLGQVLRDEPALQALEESLEQGLCSGRTEPLHGPAGAVLECLVLHCGTLVEELARPVFYLLGALSALSETQHVLLAEALETGALLESVKLVETLLEQSTPWREREAISLPAELLGSSWGSEAPGWVLLEECGLKLQVGAPQVCWEPEAQGPTCALYACLALLLRLSQLH